MGDGFFTSEEAEGNDLDVFIDIVLHHHCAFVRAISPEGFERNTSFAVLLSIVEQRRLDFLGSNCTGSPAPDIQPSTIRGYGGGGGASSYGIELSICFSRIVSSPVTRLDCP